MSRVAPRADEADMDTIVTSKRRGNRRAFDVLMEAQQELLDLYQHQQQLIVVSI